MELVEKADANPFDMHWWGELFDGWFGALAALLLLSPDAGAEKLLQRLHRMRLPHLLALTLKEKNTTWLIDW